MSVTSRNISIVVPLFNEEATLRTLRDRAVVMAEKHGLQLQIVFVDDGSKDGSWAEIAKLAVEDSRVVGLRFRRNFGKAAALAAGIEQATAPIVVTMDADLQDDPDEVPISSASSTKVMIVSAAGSRNATTLGIKPCRRRSSIGRSGK